MSAKEKWQWYKAQDVGEMWSLNYGREPDPAVVVGDIKDQTKRAVEVLLNGWKGIFPVVAVKATPDFVTKCVADRDKRIEDSSSELGNFEPFEVRFTLDGDNKKVTLKPQMITDALLRMFRKGDKTHEPKVDLVSGHCRTRFYLVIVNALRHDLGLPDIDEIPLIVYDKLTVEERAGMCAQENFLDQVGKIRPSDSAKLYMALRIVGNAEGESVESALESNGFKRGQAQKFGEIIKANARFPDLKLVRVLSTKPNLIGEIRAGDVRDMRKAGKSEKEYEKYFKNPSAGRQKAPPQASRKDLNNRIEGCPNKIEKAILNAAATDNLASLNVFTENATFYNIATDAIQSRGKQYAEVWKALEAAAEAEIAEVEEQMKG